MSVTGFGISTPETPPPGPERLVTRFGPGLGLDRDDVVTVALVLALLGLDVCAGIAFGWLVGLAGFFTLAAVWSALLLGLPRRRR